MAIPTVTITGTVASPEGVAFAEVSIAAELSQPISVLDGGVSQRVAGGAYIALTSGGALPAAGAPDAFQLVPNDIGTPSDGVYFKVRLSGVTVDGLTKIWTEKWQLASTPNPIDIGSVPRLDIVPGVKVTSTLAGNQAQADAAQSSAAAAQASKEAAAAIVAQLANLDGGSPGSAYGGMPTLDGGGI